MNYKVSKETLEATLNYLAVKPYKEVMTLIDVLRRSEEIEEQEMRMQEEKKEKKEK